MSDDLRRDAEAAAIHHQIHHELTPAYEHALGRFIIAWADAELELYRAREGISRYLSFFNTARPHTAHGGKTPDSAYFATLPATAIAA